MKESAREWGVRRLLVVVPFDLGEPVKIPEVVTCKGKVSSRIDLMSMKESSDLSNDAKQMLEKFWCDAGLERLLGANHIVATRIQPIATGVDNDTQIPWDTNAIFGTILRLSGSSGSFLDALLDDAKRVAMLGVECEQQPSVAATHALARCSHWRVTLDVVELGAACLQIEADIENPALADAFKMLALLEVAIYGHARDIAGHINKGNLYLREIRDIIVKLLRPPRSSAALRRNSTQFRPDRKGVYVRWCTNFLLVDDRTAVPDQLEKDMGQGALENPINVTDDLRVYYGGRFSVAQAGHNDVLERFKYLLAVAEWAALICVELSHEVDRRLSTSLSSGLPSVNVADDLRDARLFSEVVLSQTATWRVSSSEDDLRFIEVHGAASRLDRYRDHLRTAIETLHAIESATISEEQRMRSDRFVIAGFALSLLTAVGVLIALKDIQDLVARTTPWIEGELGVEGRIGVAIVCVVLLTISMVIWVFIRPIFRRARRGQRR